MMSQNSTENDIYRETIIGWQVVRSKNDKKNIWLYPIKINWECFVETEELDDDDELFCVIPAAPGTFDVYGMLKEPCFDHSLGLELPGAYHPNWIKELDNFKIKKLKESEGG